MRLFISLLALAIVLPVQAQRALVTTPKIGAPPPCRFVVAVDSSYSMARLKKSIASTVQALVLSGFNGQIEPGERFALWTFNQSVQNDLPPQIWIPEERGALADLTERAIKRVRFEKTTETDQLMQALFFLIEQSPELTILLFTDGDAQLAGTPFDRPINSTLQANRKRFKEAKTPFVTMLHSRKGLVLAWQIQAGNPSMTIRPLAEETVQDEEETQPAPNLAVAAVQTAPPPRTAEIPQVLIEPKPSPQSPPKQSAVAQEELRTEANIEEAKVDHAQVQSPSPIVAPSIETSLNSAAPKEDPPAIKQTDAELKTPAPSATPAAKENRPTISSAIPEATEPPSPPPQAAQSLAVPDEQTRAEQKEAPAALPASISEPTPPETPTQSDSTNIPNSTPTPAVTPAQALLPTPPGRSGAVKYALIGLALLALFGLLWLKKKSPRHSRPSIISQSLDRPRH